MTTKKSIEATRSSILTKEMLTEVTETFNMLADDNNLVLYSKLPLALKALGMSMGDTDLVTGAMMDTFTLEKFISIVIACTQKPNYAVNEMNESYRIFDRDNNGML